MSRQSCLAFFSSSILRNSLRYDRPAILQFLLFLQFLVRRIPHSTSYSTALQFHNKVDAATCAGWRQASWQTGRCRSPGILNPRP